MASQELPSTSWALATAWCSQLNQYFSGLQKSCLSLHAIVQRKPEPESKGDNFDIFIEDLNDNVSSALAELQQLEERTTDTLSFEELIVHCNALYKANEEGIRKLELQLQQCGYTPVEPLKCNGEVVGDPSHKEIETDSQDPVELISPLRNGATVSSTDVYDASVATPMVVSHQTMTVKKEAEYSPLFSDLGDLGNLESLGISATSLSALAGQEEPGEGSVSAHPLQYKLTFAESPPRGDFKISSKWAIVEEEDNLKTKYGNHWNSEAEIKLPLPPSTLTGKFGPTCEYDDRHHGPVLSDKPGREDNTGAKYSAPTCHIPKIDVPVQSSDTKKVALLDEVTSVQYDNAPVWIKLQVSMQELNSVVANINELIKQRSMREHANQYVLDQEDVQALGLGSKARAWFFINVDKLVTQNINGVTTYRIRV